MTVIGCLFILAASAQDTTSFKLLNSIPFRNVTFTTDNLGNSYVIVENQLLEFDPLGKPKNNYSDPYSGRMSSVDVTDPLKILAFYPDFQLIQILNSKLAVESTIQLRTLGILQATAVARSSKDGYWIYDLQDAQLKKLTLNLQLQQQSGNLNQLLGQRIVPDYIVERNNFVYMNNPSTGILIFDQYGTYVKTLPFAGLKSFQVIENALLFPDSNRFNKYNLKTLQLTEVLTPPHDSLVNARIEQDKLFLLTTSALSFYNY